MDDKAGDTARETVGEFRDQGTVLPAEHVDTAVQVDRRKVSMRRDEPEDPLQLVRGVGVEFGGHAHLGKTESGQLEERIVPGERSLEQAVDRSGCLPVLAAIRGGGFAGVPVTRAGDIHDPHLAAWPMVSSSTLVVLIG
jgi:hypothetical protein